MNRLLVIAGTFNEYVSFCNLTGLRDRVTAEYLVHLDMIAGTKMPKDFILVGTWWARDNVANLVEVLTARGCTQLNTEDFINERTRV